MAQTAQRVPLVRKVLLVQMVQTEQLVPLVPPVHKDLLVQMVLME